MTETSAYSTSLREEELKNKVAADWFGSFDCTRIIGNIDFCVDIPATELALGFAGGTGNLEVGLTNKYNVFVSTLDQQDIDVIHERIKNGANLLDSNVFQFDFLMQHFADIPLVRQYSVTNGLAGDRCYCLTLPDGFSCVDFTRNNVFVDIAAYTNCLSAFDIAVQLDAAILNVSTNAPGR